MTLKVRAQRPDHGRFAFGEIGRTGDAVEGIAVADDREVGPGVYSASPRSVAAPR